VVLPFIPDRIERRAGRDQSAAIRMLQGLRGRALGFAGGIAEGEDDGAFAVVGHCANGLWCEVTRLAGGADKDGGPNGPDQLLPRIRWRGGEAEGGEAFPA